MTPVLHLTSVSTWLAGGDIEPDSLRTEGFVHTCPDESTMLAVANAFYRTHSESQIVLVVDTERLESPVRWEDPVPAPPPGVADGVRFPHIYGPLTREAVVGIRYARRDPEGAFVAFEQRGATAEALDLLPHPEGGWYRQTWRSSVTVLPEGYPGPRPTATGIHFLLTPGEESCWHRVRSEEMWVFNRGGPLLLRLGGGGAHPEPAESFTLGPDVTAGHHPQVLVPAGTWQSAVPMAGETLVSCFVSPGFDFADFEAAPGDSG
ncbi:cupin domain-containing protein [Salinactinospora qingdaonensis]|uniref:DUF985 domain-containing protein n=1 Tax=Salinactinospora qingdaonensis TaxID=702744 RepID=A0ABP7F1E9_9ACTN